MWPTFLVGGHVCLQNNSLEGTPVWIHGVSCLRTIGLVISHYPLASLNKNFTYVFSLVAFALRLSQSQNMLTFYPGLVPRRTFICFNVLLSQS